MGIKQCDWTNPTGARCAYVDDHSGEHLYPARGEDCSDAIRLKFAQDVRDREIAELRECLRLAHYAAHNQGDRPWSDAVDARIAAALGEVP
jgi:hypothetical protein